MKSILLFVSLISFAFAANVYIANDYRYDGYFDTLNKQGQLEFEFPSENAYCPPIQSPNWLEAGHMAQIWPSDFVYYVYGQRVDQNSTLWFYNSLQLHFTSTYITMGQNVNMNSWSKKCAEVKGTAPNRRIIFSWVGVNPTNITSQIKFYEQGHMELLHYSYYGPINSMGLESPFWGSNWPKLGLYTPADHSGTAIRFHRGVCTTCSSTLSTCNSDGGIAKVQIYSAWTGGFCANVEVKNTGTSTVTGWDILSRFDIPITVSSVWDATQVSCTSGNVIRLTSTKTLIAGSTDLSAGFCATYSGSTGPTVLKSFGTLGASSSSSSSSTTGVAPPATTGLAPPATTGLAPPATTGLASVTSGSSTSSSTGSGSCASGCSLSICTDSNNPDPVVTETSSWSGGYCASIVLNNPSSNPVSNWNGLLTFSHPVTITSFWGFQFANCPSNPSSTIKISPPAWGTGGISPSGSNTDLGFCVSHSGGSSFSFTGAKIAYSF